MIMIFKTVWALFLTTAFSFAKYQGPRGSLRAPNHRLLYNKTCITLVLSKVKLEIISLMTPSFNESFRWILLNSFYHCARSRQYPLCGIIPLILKTENFTSHLLLFIWLDDRLKQDGFLGPMLTLFYFNTRSLLSILRFNLR